MLGVTNIYFDSILRGENRILVKTPKVRSVAANYFGCPTVSGVELENQGGGGSAGSHWERVLLFNEIMTASSFEFSSYSEFTMALMADTGWYQVDFTLSEYYIYI